MFHQKLIHIGLEMFIQYECIFIIADRNRRYGTALLHAPSRAQHPSPAALLLSERARDVHNGDGTSARKEAHPLTRAQAEQVRHRHAARRLSQQPAADA